MVDPDLTSETQADLALTSGTKNNLERYLAEEHLKNVRDADLSLIPSELLDGVLIEKVNILLEQDSIEDTLYVLGKILNKKNKEDTLFDIKRHLIDNGELDEVESAEIYLNQHRVSGMNFELSSKQYLELAKNAFSNGDLDTAYKVCRRKDTDAKPLISAIAGKFLENGDLDGAKEAYIDAQDIAGLMNVMDSYFKLFEKDPKETTKETQSLELDKIARIIHKIYDNEQWIAKEQASVFEVQLSKQVTRVISAYYMTEPERYLQKIAFISKATHDNVAFSKVMDVAIKTKDDIAIHEIYQMQNDDEVSGIELLIK
jgi:hypothetical protein